MALPLALAPPSTYSKSFQQQQQQQQHNTQESDTQRDAVLTSPNASYPLSSAAVSANRFVGQALPPPSYSLYRLSSSNSSSSTINTINTGEAIHTKRRGPYQLLCRHQTRPPRPQDRKRKLPVAGQRTLDVYRSVTDTHRHPPMPEQAAGREGSVTLETTPLGPWCGSPSGMSGTSGSARCLLTHRGKWSLSVGDQNNSSNNKTVTHTHTQTHTHKYAVLTMDTLYLNHIHARHVSCYLFETYLKINKKSIENNKTMIGTPPPLSLSLWFISGERNKTHRTHK